MSLSQDEIDKMMTEGDGKEDPRSTVIEQFGKLFGGSIENIIPVLVGSEQTGIDISQPASGQLDSLIETQSAKSVFFIYKESRLTETTLAGYIAYPLALNISQKMMGQEGAEELNEALVSALVEASNNIFGAFDTALKEDFQIDDIEHGDLKFLEGSPLEALESEAGMPSDTNVWLIRISVTLDDLSGDFGLIVSDQALNEMYEKHPASKQAAEKAAETAEETAETAGEETAGKETAGEEPVDAETQPTSEPQELSPDSAVTLESAAAQQEIPVARFEELDPRKATGETKGIDLIMDVPLRVTVELGRMDLPVKEILNLTPGSLVELDKLAGEPVDLLVNGKLFAKGEVVVIDENFGVRVSSIVTHKERIETMGG